VPDRHTDVTKLSVRVDTPRLIMRAPLVTDVPELRLLMRKNAEHLRPVSPLARPGEDSTSITELSNVIARQRREWRQDRGYSVVVTLKHPDRPIIGRLALNNIVRGVFQNAYLGYWIDASHQGRGLMTEAVRGILGFAFDTLKLHRVQIAIMPRNEKSLRVVERLGIRKEGHALRYLEIAGAWEDHEIFAVTAGETLAPDRFAPPA
jgi:ribosomal-protein-alanine N-acetyltransferase